MVSTRTCHSSLLSSSTLQGLLGGVSQDPELIRDHTSCKHDLILGVNKSPGCPVLSYILALANQVVQLTNATANK